jgi:hypothetical protein
MGSIPPSVTSLFLGNFISSYLRCNTDCLEEIDLSGRIDYLLGGIVPVEIHNGFLETEKVVNSADNDVNSCRVSGLGSQVVLPV